MNTRIHTLELGLCNVFLLQSRGTIAVDAGPPGKEKTFTRGLDRARIAPSEIRLLVLTHGHWDHIGSARAVQKVTGSPIAMHSAERDCLERSVVRVPPGTSAWSRFLVAVMGRFEHRIRIEPARVDRVLGDEPVSLVEYGIPGDLIPTPGHSPGSVSVLLTSGDCFVGDLAMNGLPLRFGPGPPIFADDPARVERSWKILLDRGAKTIYPAHGKPFDADLLRRRLITRSERG